MFPSHVKHLVGFRPKERWPAGYYLPLLTFERILQLRKNVFHKLGEANKCTGEVARLGCRGVAERSQPRQQD